MSPTEAETFALGDNVKGLIVREAPALKKGGMDVDTAIVTLDAVLQGALAANTLQHDLRRESQAATARSVEMTHRLYVTASGFLDMAMAAVQKDSPAAKEFRVLRSRMRRPREGEETPAPAPEPAA